MFFFPYNPPPPLSRQTPLPSHSRELDFGLFRVRFGSFSGPSWGVVSGRGGVVERGGSVREKMLLVKRGYEVSLPTSPTCDLVTLEIRSSLSSGSSAMSSTSITSTSPNVIAASFSVSCSLESGQTTPAPRQAQGQGLHHWQ